MIRSSSPRWLSRGIIWLALASACTTEDDGGARDDGDEHGARDDGDEHGARSELAELPGVAPAAVVARAPLTFFLDAVSGNDLFPGTSATVASGNGPWRTLTRASTASFAPGDRVLLRCGQVFAGTLTVRQSGTASAPITFSSFPTAPCVGAANPVIDPSIALTAWTAVAGAPGVYRTTVTGAVTQLVTATGRVEPARFPSRPGPTSPAFAPTVAIGASADGRQTATVGIAGLPAGTLAADLTGATLVFRDSAFTVRSAAVASATVSGAQATLTLATPTGYVAQVGAGYYLANRLWMLRSGFGWVQDGTTIYLRLPTSAAPASGAVRATTANAIGIAGGGTAHVTWSNLAVRNADVGVTLASAIQPRLQGVAVARSARLGVSAPGTQAATFDGLTVTDSHVAGVVADNSSALTLANSTIADSGTIGSPVGGPSNLNGFGCGACRALAVRDNRILRSGYSGVISVPPPPGPGVPSPLPPSTIERNLIEDSCMVLDDCGAMYTSSRYGAAGFHNPTTVRDNLVIRSRGNADGRVGGSSAQGLYFDDYANGTAALGNVVYDADSTIQHHLGWDATFRGNVLVAPRVNGLWMQENAGNHTACVHDPLNCMKGNLVEQNQFVLTRPSVGVSADSSYASTEDFGTFRDNRYVALVSTVIGRAAQLVGTARIAAVFPAPAWGSRDGFPFGRGAAAETGLSQQVRPTPGAPPASDVFPPMRLELAGDRAAFALWPAQASATWGSASGNGGGGLRIAAPVGAGASAALLSAGQFDVVPGERYLVSFEVRTDVACPTCAHWAIVRSRVSGWEPFAPARAFTPTTSWQAVSFVLPAHTASGPAGARLDLQVPPGRVLYLDNLRLRRIAPPVSLAAHGDFADGGAAWRGYPSKAGFNAGADGAQAPYLRVDTRATAVSTVVSSPRLAVVERRRYLLRFEARGGTAARVSAMLREDGPSYHVLSAVSTPALTGDWQVFAFAIDARRSTTAARLDFDVPAGVVVDLDDVTLTELAASPALSTVAIEVASGGAAPSAAAVQVLYNGGSASVNLGCPGGVGCDEYVAISGAGTANARVTWPILIAPRRAAVVLRAPDRDRDGVLDADDHCPGTAPGASADELGCSVAQLR